MHDDPDPLLLDCGTQRVNRDIECNMYRVMASSVEVAFVTRRYADDSSKFTPVSAVSGAFLFGAWPRESMRSLCHR